MFFNNVVFFFPVEYSTRSHFFKCCHFQMRGRLSPQNVLHRLERNEKFTALAAPMNILEFSSLYCRKIIYFLFFTSSHVCTNIHPPLFSQVSVKQINQWYPVSRAAVLDATSARWPVGPHMSGCVDLWPVLHFAQSPFATMGAQSCSCESIPCTVS